MPGDGAYQLWWKQRMLLADPKACHWSVVSLVDGSHSYQEACVVLQHVMILTHCVIHCLLALNNCLLMLSHCSFMKRMAGMPVEWQTPCTLEQDNVVLGHCQRHHNFTRVRTISSQFAFSCLTEKQFLNVNFCRLWNAIIIHICQYVGK